MPTSFAAALVVALVMVPGILGDRIFRVLVGVDWREREWRGAARVVGFSAVGLALYSIAAQAFGLPPARHVFPEAYLASARNPNEINMLFLSYAGHLVGGALAGIGGCWASKVLAKLSSSSAYPGAWDDLVRVYAPDHWVVVGLTSGDVYAGKLKTADVAVSTAERDIVLEEPAQYDTKTGRYCATPYQFQFIQASTIFSISVVHEPRLESRVVAVGDYLFQEREDAHSRAANAPAKTVPALSSAAEAVSSASGNKGGMAPERSD
jgi:hypothetical protein